MIQIGDLLIKDLFIGENRAKTVFLGNTQVWSSSEIDPEEPETPEYVTLTLRIEGEMEYVDVTANGEEVFYQSFPSNTTFEIQVVAGSEIEVSAMATNPIIANVIISDPFFIITQDTEVTLQQDYWADYASITKENLTSADVNYWPHIIWDSPNDGSFDLSDYYATYGGILPEAFAEEVRQGTASISWAWPEELLESNDPHIIFLQDSLEFSINCIYNSYVALHIIAKHRYVTLNVNYDASGTSLSCEVAITNEIAGSDYFSVEAGDGSSPDTFTLQVIRGSTVDIYPPSDVTILTEVYEGELYYARLLEDTNVRLRCTYNWGDELQVIVQLNPDNQEGAGWWYPSNPVFNIYNFYVNNAAGVAIYENDHLSIDLASTGLDYMPIYVYSGYLALEASYAGARTVDVNGVEYNYDIQCNGSAIYLNIYDMIGSM